MKEESNLLIRKRFVESNEKMFPIFNSLLDHIQKISQVAGRIMARAVGVLESSVFWCTVRCYVDIRKVEDFHC